MTRKITHLLFGIVWLVSATAAFAQDAATDVHVKLSLADDKTAYRSGDPIKLVLEFTADREGYDVDGVRDKASASTSDEILITPDAGIFRWAEEYTRGSPYARDYFSVQELSAIPTRVMLLVNDVVRFDRAGKYSVRVRTRRVTQRRDLNDRAPRAVTLTSNEISFEVQPMSAADEEKEVQRLTAALDAAHGAQAEETLTEELSFLAGDASSREKVRRFLNSEGRSGNYFQNINLGLYIARNRGLVFGLLEAALRDPGIPVTYGLLSALTKLRLMQENSGLPEKPLTNVATLDPFGDPKFTAIQDAYVGELGAGLSKRTGKSQTTTAITILTRLPRNTETAAPLLHDVRRILLQQFDGLHPYDQEYLLRVYWEQLRDPSLIPSLKKMLSATGIASKNIHDSGLKRLIEIDPDEARSYVIAEIRDRRSLVDFEILGSLGDESLPEIDATLLDQIRQFASSSVNFDRVYLKHKSSLAARYATEAIYPDLMQIYRDGGAKLPNDARPGFLAYFARHNEPEALSLIEQTLDGLAPGEDFSLLPDLTRLYYPDGLDILLRKRLESDEPRAVSTAAYLLSLHGPASDEKVIEARLDRWLKEWSNRAAEAESNLQATAERELVQALMRAKSWKASPDRLRQLQQGCVTRLCRQNFPAQ